MAARQSETAQGSEAYNRAIKDVAQYLRDVSSEVETGEGRQILEEAASAIEAVFLKGRPR